MSRGRIMRQAVAAVCASFGESPEGERHWFVDGEHRSETFTERNRAAVVAVLKSVRQSLQDHAESLPVEEYGRFRPAVEWLDDVIGSAP